MNNTTNKQKLLLVFNEAKRHFPQLQREEEIHYIGDFLKFYSSTGHGEFYQIEFQDATFTSNGNSIKLELTDRENITFDFEQWIENVLHEITNQLAHKLTKEFSR